MSSVVESISRVIEVARRLRAIAEELHNVDLKSQIVDEISTLQEIRETLGEAPNAGVQQVAPPTPAGGHGGHYAAPRGISQAVGFQVIQPSTVEETYSLKAEEEPEPPPPTPAPAPPEETKVEAKDASKAEAKPVAKATEKAPTKPSAPVKSPAVTVPPKPTPTAEIKDPEQRAKQAEHRIAELEPLQQAILKRMNDILTPDQRKSRLLASKSARESGKTGAELQQIINQAMHLSPEQQTQWMAAKKDLQSVRADIAKEVQHLLSDEQKHVVDGSEG